MREVCKNLNHQPARETIFSDNPSPKALEVREILVSKFLEFAELDEPTDEKPDDPELAETLKLAMARNFPGMAILLPRALFIEKILPQLKKLSSDPDEDVR